MSTPPPPPLLQYHSRYIARWNNLVKDGIYERPCSEERNRRDSPDVLYANQTSVHTLTAAYVTPQTLQEDHVWTIETCMETINLLRARNNALKEQLLDVDTNFTDHVQARQRKIQELTLAVESASAIKEQ